MIPLLLACTSPSPSGRVPAPAPTSTPTPTAPAPTSASVPLLDEALVGRCPDPTPSGLPPPGDDLHRATLSDPAALCNDGSPAILWVRAGQPEHAGDWVLYLDGGRYCDDHETCAARWCGETAYDASKMSTRWAPETRGADGLAGTAPGNPFRGWNQVSFHYCSSDRWTGTRRDVTFAEDPPYRLHFAGADIVDAARVALAAGLTSDDGAAVMPSLADADRVLFTGSSAGGKGAAWHLDRFAEALPGVEVSGVIDAVFDPDLDAVEPALAAVIDADTRAVEEAHSLTWAQIGDTSCAAAGLGWRCADTSVLLREHVTTPFLLHHDLFDPDILDLDLGPLGMTGPQYLASALDTFARWEAEGSGGSFVLTGCGVHTYLSAQDRFVGFRTADADGGPALSLAEAIDAWVGGSALQVADNSEGSGSTCP